MIPDGQEPTSIALTDVNEDGHLDIVAGDRASDTVQIALGDGHGAFSTTTLTVPGDGQTPARAWGVAAGDFNGDGHVDIAVADLELRGRGLVHRRRHGPLLSRRAPGARHRPLRHRRRRRQRRRPRRHRRDACGRPRRQPPAQLEPARAGREHGRPRLRRRAAGRDRRSTPDRRRHQHGRGAAAPSREPGRRRLRHRVRRLRRRDRATRARAAPCACASLLRRRACARAA